MSRTAAALAVAAAIFWSTPSLAQAPQSPPPENRINHRSLVVARVNPVGLLYEGRITYRRRLYEHDSAALRDNFVAVGLAPTLSPAYARLGAVVEVQPLSVLQLWGMYEVLGYFGTFNHLQSFATVDADHSDTVLDARADLPAGDPLMPYATTGTQLTLGATLQAKVGPVAARSQLRLVRPDLQLRDGDEFFYDITYDLLAQNRGWFLSNDVDVLYQTTFGLTAGVRWNFTRALYRGTAEDPNTPIHRVGPLVAYTFWTEEHARFNTPTVLLIVNWWLSHRYRTGVDTSQVFPYVALGFAFTGDLLPAR